MTTTSEAASIPKQATGEEAHQVRVAELAAEVTAALISGWEAIRARHPEIPEAVVSMATGGRESQVKLAHFAPRRWRDREGSTVHHEVFVTAESLSDGAAKVFESLLHEGAHALCEARGVDDCSASQYHNRKFARAAAELGLGQKTGVDPKWKKKYGFAGTTLPEQTRALYADQITALDRAIHATRVPNVYATRSGGGRGGRGPGAGTLDLGDLLGLDLDDADDQGQDGPPQKEDRNYVRAVCGCEPPTVIRVSPRTLQRGHIMCALCTTVFTS